MWFSEVQLAGMFDEYVTAIALLSVTLLAKGADVEAAATFVVDIAEVATTKPAAGYSALVRNCNEVKCPGKRV